MTDSLSRQTFSPRSLIFREGEPGDRAYVIERGTVEISALRDGKEILLARFGEGELFGEMALIDGQVRSASARAVDGVTLIVIRRDHVQIKVENADPLLNLFLKVILERLRSTTTLIDLERQGAGEASQEPVRQDGSIDHLRERAMIMLSAEQELRRAVAENEFVLRYQPIVALSTGHLAGFEALIRWLHPERGLLMPLEFIRLAEETGMIVPIGLWTFEKACQALVRFNGARPPDAPVFLSVNLSARQISEPSLVEDMRSIIAGAGADPSLLKLEVTESVLMEDPERAVGVLGRLSRLGMELAIDDFGTGYSSLSYLTRFPIDAIKVDRSFVNTMLSEPGNLKIVRAITSLAKELGLAIVAEGVERREELTLISDFGCEYAQGFLFSKPLSPTDAAASLHQRYR